MTAAGSAQALFPAVVPGEAERPALTALGTTLTRGRLAAALSRYAECLETAGIRPGDRVAVWTDRALETPVALLGNAAFGVVSVPLNPSLGTRELDHVLSDAQPKLIVAASDDAASRTPDADVLRATVDATGDAAPAPRLVDDDPLLILYTSGTTGAPKGAVLSARNVAANLDGLAEAWDWSASDTVTHALPLFHVHGLVLGLYGSRRAGSHLHWVPRFSPEKIGAALAAGATMLFAVPTMYHRLADAAETDPALAAALGGARLLVSGSAGLPLRDHRRIEELTGKTIVERYGLTETLINTAVPHGAPRPGYVGPPVPGVELRLVDDDRSPLEGDAAHDDRTIGEVAVRGPSVFTGYLNRPDATAAVRDDDGWFYTGDLATMTTDGAVRIVGRRATDLIKTGGFKVGAGEVEGALLEDADVAEAAVLGLPDDDLGQRIVAFVVPRDAAAPPPVARLVEGVAAALSPHKRPREVRFIDSLPRNAMGKVQKKRLLPEPSRD
ncbi:MAG: acyl-CoA synthetase [Deltaproteobacteria bacterium]|nr:MAG: acyl-CoA synthetase [Deltaproteobacteria bacterium]